MTLNFRNNYFIQNSSLAEHSEQCGKKKKYFLKSTPIYIIFGIVVSEIFIDIARISNSFKMYFGKILEL